MIRRATFEDIPAMLEMGRRAHARSRYCELAIDETTAKMNVAGMMTNKSQLVIVAERDGVLIGMLLGISVPWFFSSRSYATDLLWYAERPGVGVRLMRRFITWALKDRKVDSIESSVSFGGTLEQTRETEEIYARLGFRRVGGATFVMQRGDL
jgi:hypothetical protein